MARTKHVFGKSSQVAHVWAQQTQESGRNGSGNIYFEGPTIFSYGGHFPIAMFVKNKRGQRAVLFTTRRYSNTTAGHISDAHNALRGLDLPILEVDLKEHRYTPGGSKDQRKKYEQQIAEHLDKACRARATWSIESHRGQAARTTAMANAYSKFYGLRWRLPEIPALDDAKWAKVEEAEAKRSAARRVKEAAAEAAREAAAAVRRQEYQEKLAAWVRGEDVLLPHNWMYGYQHDDGVSLRVRGDRVETSRGAEFPAEHAKLAFKVIARCRERGEGWETNGRTVHLGHFKIDRIAPDGEVKAGCHVVKWPAIEHVARQLGLIAGVPA